MCSFSGPGNEDRTYSGTDVVLSWIMRRGPMCRPEGTETPKLDRKPRHLDERRLSSLCCNGFCNKSYQGNTLVEKMNS